MVNFSISNAKYTYVHDQKYPSEAVDIHHIVVRKSGAKDLCVCISAILVLACAFYLCVLKEKSITLLYYSLLFDIFLVNLLLRKPIEKESVVIIPAFGVQLETHYRSGKVIRCFVPIDKILKPVLLECVTPVTCYWTLSLIVHEESELVLIFKNLRPPVKMLVHVWKALCAATVSKEGLDDSIVDDGNPDLPLEFQEKTDPVEGRKNLRDRKKAKMLQALRVAKTFHNFLPKFSPHLTLIPPTPVYSYFSLTNFF